jgi:type IV pilus assembly protein PilM
LAPRTTNFIGLDIGSRYFRAVRVKKVGDEFLVQDKLTGSIDELGQLSAKMHLMDNEELCVNCNPEDIVIKRVSIPLMPQEEIGSALKWELKEQVRFDIDKARVKFNVIGERKTEDGMKRIDLIAFAYQETGIRPKVKQLKEMGLNVQNVMPLDFALAKYANNAKIVPQDEKVAILDIGSVKTLISIIEKDKVCFTREISIGGDTITDAMTGVIITDKGRMELSKQDAENMKKEQGISSDIKMLSLIRPVLEKLTGQIKSSLEYYGQRFAEQDVKKLILAGNGSQMRGLKEYIIKETGLEVLGILPEEAGAIGLALSRDFNLNMLPEEFMAEDKKALKRFSMTMITFVLAGMLLFSYALLCIQAINLKKGIDIQRQHWDNLQEVRLLRDKIITYNNIINTVSLDSINASPIMKEISNLILSDMVLDKFVIDNKQPNIIISGIALKQDSLTGFMSKLESNVLFNNVKLSFSEKIQKTVQDAVKFEITCNIRK